MKASELRIGNLIKTNIIQKVNIQHLEFLLNTELNHSIIKPIPLTAEWLVRLGYKKEGYDYWNGPAYCELAELSNGNWINSINGNEYDNGIEIKYVHQLQNLYFALTGEELVYELNPSNTPTD